MPALDLTPNVGSEASDFFQTDEALERQSQKLEKQNRLKDAGNPVKCASKVLDLLVVPKSADATEHQQHPYLLSAESGFIARIFSANVSLNYFISCRSSRKDWENGADVSWTPRPCHLRCSAARSSFPRRLVRCHWFLG